MNYYCNIWPRRSHMLAPLTKLTYIKKKFKWTQVTHDAFDEIKRIFARDTLLGYRNFNKKKFNTDVSAFQLGVVSSQKIKPVFLYSRKLTDAQQRYTVTERELLITIETLKQLRTALLCQKFNIYDDN